MPVRIAVPRTEPQALPSTQTLHNQQLQSQPLDGNGTATVAAHRDDSITYDIRTGKPINSDIPHSTTATTAAAASVKPTSGKAFIQREYNCVLYWGIVADRTTLIACLLYLLSCSMYIVL
jgi:hypothetical protein